MGSPANAGHRRQVLVRCLISASGPQRAACLAHDLRQPTQGRGTDEAHRSRTRRRSTDRGCSCGVGVGDGDSDSDSDSDVLQHDARGQRAPQLAGVDQHAAWWGWKLRRFPDCRPLDHGRRLHERPPHAWCDVARPAGLDREHHVLQQQRQRRNWRAAVDPVHLPPELHFDRCRSCLASGDIQLGG